MPLCILLQQKTGLLDSAAIADTGDDIQQHLASGDMIIDIIGSYGFNF